MRSEERIAQLEAENAKFQAKVVSLSKQLARALVRLHKLEGQVAKDWVAQSFDVLACSFVAQAPPRA
jgi:uncharacterized coiled-coil protein SlyX